ncbi:MAG: DUF2061 domain-containing protein [Candidatus Freyrarchaeum guaymaensis]|nr:DUF2061 domain-containing protein [Candidatus Sigynarchaeota archaeon]
MVAQSEERPIEEPRVRHHRDLAEAVTWRLVALTTEFTIAYIILGNITISAEIALATSALLIIFYVLHRKAWRRVKWGFHKP